MAYLFDASGHKIAKIGDDERVRNMAGVSIGKVAFNGDVYNGMGEKVGTVEENGDIYQEGKKIGTVKNNGDVFDYEGRRVGKVAGGNVKLGGAALLLLAR